MRPKAGKKLGVIPFEGDMAVKRGFGIEKPSSELRDRTSPQNPKAAKPENVDALVSHFLAELSDLSSEMKGTGKPADDSESKTKAEDARLPSPSRLEEESGSVPDGDLDRISAEIEKSLAELETLRPAFSVPKEIPLPDEEIIPEEPAVIAKDEAARKPVSAPSIVVPAEQTWKRREIFSNNLAKPKQASRLSVGWILAGLVLIGIIGVSAFYFLRSGGSAVKPVKDVSLAETKSPDLIREQTKAAPIIEEKSTAITDTKKSSKSAAPVKTPAQETRENKPAPKSAAPSKETSVSRTSGSGTPPENKHPDRISKHEIHCRANPGQRGNAKARFPSGCQRCNGACSTASPGIHNTGGSTSAEIKPGNSRTHGGCPGGQQWRNSRQHPRSGSDSAGSETRPTGKQRGTGYRGAAENKNSRHGGGHNKSIPSLPCFGEGTKNQREG